MSRPISSRGAGGGGSGGGGEGQQPFGGIPSFGGMPFFGMQHPGMMQMMQGGGGGGGGSAAAAAEPDISSGEEERRVEERKPMSRSYKNLGGKGGIGRSWRIEMVETTSAGSFTAPMLVDSDDVELDKLVFIATGLKPHCRMADLRCRNKRDPY